MDPFNMTGTSEPPSPAHGIDTSSAAYHQAVAMMQPLANNGGSPAAQGVNVNVQHQTNAADGSSTTVLPKPQTGVEYYTMVIQQQINAAQQMALRKQQQQQQQNQSPATSMPFNVMGPPPAVPTPGAAGGGMFGQPFMSGPNYWMPNQQPPPGSASSSSSITGGGGMSASAGPPPKPRRGRPPGSGGKSNRGGHGPEFSKKPHKKRRAKSSEVSSKIRSNYKKKSSSNNNNDNSSIGGGGGRSSSSLQNGENNKRQNMNRYKILDDDEARIVNPLLQVYIKPHHLANLDKPKSSSTLGGVLGAVGGGGTAAGYSQSSPASTTSSSGHTSSRKNPTNGSELLVPMELVFHKPDTYPLSYLARLLGFDVPVPSFIPPPSSTESNTDTATTSTTTNAGGGGGINDEQPKNDDNGKTSSLAGGGAIAEPPGPYLPTFPTPLPDPEALPFVRERPGYEDPFLQIPEVTSDYRRLQRTVCRLGDRDDQVTLDYIDPVYHSLLVAGADGSLQLIKPTASSWAHKFAAIQQDDSKRRHEFVLEVARKVLQGTELSSCLDDWTFHDWTTVNQSRTTNLATVGATAAPGGEGTEGRRDSTSEVPGTSQAIGNTPGATSDTNVTESDPKPPTPPPRPPPPQWTIDGSRVFHSPTPQSFGIVAKYKGRPVAILKWRFMWYQLPPSESSAGLTSGGFVASSATIAKKRQEAELVIFVDGIDDLPKDRKLGTRRTVSQNWPPKENIGGTSAADVNNMESPRIARQTSISEDKADDVVSSERVTTPDHPEQAWGMSGDAVDHDEAGEETVQTVGGPRVDPKAGTGDSAGMKILAEDNIEQKSIEELSSSGMKETDHEGGEVGPSAPKVELNSAVHVVMTALALEHARSCDVWYGLVKTPDLSTSELYEKIFRMVPLHDTENKSESCGVPNVASAACKEVDPTALLVCDMKKSSSRYAMLRMKQGDSPSLSREEAVVDESMPIVRPEYHRERCLVRMPDTDQAKVWLKKQTYPSASKGSGASDRIFTSVAGHRRHVCFGVRINLSDHKRHEGSHEGKQDETPKRELIRLNGDGTVDETAGNLWNEKRLVEQLASIDSDNNNEPQHLDILRHFSLPASTMESERVNDQTADQSVSANVNAEKKDEILSCLLQKQKELVSMERAMEPRLRRLLSKVVTERIEYEKPESVQRRAEEKRILEENEKVVARRKELDLAWQKQLEQDMDAVCQVCADGEVTPDNQILFCEACNVAIHQMCYGIAVVPEGDYYCIACRYFKRESMTEVIARKMKRDGPVPTRKITPPPLPICCELCPRKQGAYIRSDFQLKAKPIARASIAKNGNPTSETTQPPAKWVHMVCAKWQGLNFVDESQEVVEDVTELKTYFRRMEVKCEICRGQRGAYNKCRFEGCDKWLHISCARDSGLCEVVHGEDVQGKIEHNPWTLLCQEHTELPPIKGVEDREFVSVDLLVEEAKALPPEPTPPPMHVERRPFNKLTGEERNILLQEPDYEKEVLDELMKRKLSGARCEVCDTCDETGFNSMRCVSCKGIVCVSCRVPTNDEVEQNYKCSGCTVAAAMEEKTESSDDLGDKAKIVKPKCCLCQQPGGLLLESFGNPVNKASYWKHNPKEFTKTLFAKPLWCHILCAFWHKGLGVDPSIGKVDCSNVIMANGRGFVNGKNRCGLCGFKTGMKAKCAEPTCRGRGETSKAWFFHTTCARQAGYEVDHDDDLDETPFYVKCYNHGDNLHNLRARLEDLVEIEKKRAGKRLGKLDNAMTLAHASRLLNHAILVMRMLGWAWKWAELWVEHGSSWEPLLEEGQIEENMTKAQLKIVDSTPESRCKDARKCRLAAFGAALRNRNYDTEDGYDNEALDLALRSILHTKSLVGPLRDVEIDVLAEWLGRAYRSESRLLGFGSDKIPVSPVEFSTLHYDDKSPKYELGSRPIPGSRGLRAGEVFEESVSEPDDFLKPERSESGELVAVTEVKAVSQTSKKRRRRVVETSDEAEPPKKRPGRRKSESSSDGSPYASSRFVSAAPHRRRGRRPFEVTIPTPTDIASEPPAKTYPISLSLEAMTCGFGLPLQDGSPNRRARRGRPPRPKSVAVTVVTEEFVEGFLLDDTELSSEPDHEVDPDKNEDIVGPIDPEKETEAEPTSDPPPETLVPEPVIVQEAPGDSSDNTNRDQGEGLTNVAKIPEDKVPPAPSESPTVDSSKQKSKERIDETEQGLPKDLRDEKEDSGQNKEAINSLPHSAVSEVAKDISDDTHANDDKDSQPEHGKSDDTRANDDKESRPGNDKSDDTRTIDNKESLSEPEPLGENRAEPMSEVADDKLETKLEESVQDHRVGESVDEPQVSKTTRLSTRRPPPPAVPKRRSTRSVMGLEAMDNGEEDARDHGQNIRRSTRVSKLPVSKPGTAADTATENASVESSNTSSFEIESTANDNDDDDGDYYTSEDPFKTLNDELPSQRESRSRTNTATDRSARASRRASNKLDQSKHEADGGSEHGEQGNEAPLRDRVDKKKGSGAKTSSRVVASKKDQSRRSKRTQKVGDGDISADSPARRRSSRLSVEASGGRPVSYKVDDSENSSLNLEVDGSDDPEDEIPLAQLVESARSKQRGKGDPSSRRIGGRSCAESRDSATGDGSDDSDNDDDDDDDFDSNEDEEEEEEEEDLERNSPKRRGRRRGKRQAEKDALKNSPRKRRR